MPRGIFGMRLVLVVKGSAEAWFMRHSPLNAALCLITKNQWVMIVLCSLCLSFGAFAVSSLRKFLKNH